MKLSIVTINRNNAEGLFRTLESTLHKQGGFDDYEQIVIDGASTDSSLSVLAQFRDSPRLSKVVSEPDDGIYQAMNKGARMASGDYLLFVNSGDALVENVLSRVFSVPWEADIAYGDLFIGLEQGAPLRTYPDCSAVSTTYFLHSFLPHPASFISRRLFVALDGYDERFRIAADTDFFLSAVRNDAHMVHLPFPISRFDMGGISNSFQQKSLQIRERARYLGRVFNPRLIWITLLGGQLETYVPESMPCRFASDPNFRTIVTILPEWLDWAYGNRAGRLFLRAIVRQGRRTKNMRAINERKSLAAQQQAMFEELSSKIFDASLLKTQEERRSALSAFVYEFGPEMTARCLLQSGLNFVADSFSDALPELHNENGGPGFVFLATGLDADFGGGFIARTIEQLSSGKSVILFLTDTNPGANDVPVRAQYRRRILPTVSAEWRDREMTILSTLGESEGATLVVVQEPSPNFALDVLTARLAGFPVVIIQEKPLWDVASSGGAALSDLVCALRLANIVMAPSKAHSEALLHMGINAVSSDSSGNGGSVFGLYRAVREKNGFGSKPPNSTPEGRMLSSLVRMHSFGVAWADSQARQMPIPPWEALERPPASQLPFRLLRFPFDALNWFSWRLRQTVDWLGRKSGES